MAGNNPEGGMNHPFAAGHEGFGPCEIAMTRAGTFPALCLNRKAAFRVLVFRGTTVRTRHFRLYKHYAHEGGISSPFIACWPAVIKPTANPVNMVGHETDVMPTFRTGLRYLSKDGGSRPHTISCRREPCACHSEKIT